MPQKIILPMLAGLSQGAAEASAAEPIHKILTSVRDGIYVDTQKQAGRDDEGLKITHRHRQ